MDKIMNDLIMFDFQHFYQRIAKELPNNARLAEVGIANGDSVIYLAQELKNLGKDFKIYAIDNMGYGGFFQMKTIYENIIKSGLGDYIEVMPYPSLECAKMFNDGFLDFVYIDSSHTYKETKQEVIEWYNKVKDEGVLAGHDFNADEVNRAVSQIVPKIFIRSDIADREFEAEKVLHSEETANGWGLWWFKKQWYLKLNKF
jgi:predicted O-methyltransferase YrrM